MMTGSAIVVLSFKNQYKVKKEESQEQNRTKEKIKKIQLLKSCYRLLALMMETRHTLNNIKKLIST